ncbi:PEPxxWA-CTERM sorting domain-containing protein [Parasphingorhabdus cellanae]|uniref:PEP-CTERM sorting domain-containing protein n=1 Tax=Parasphingorhabdus cellanae TaxID=2806553 RepID=A0ABX7TA96_9SPHN|nr:PEPxxWA-CTERM sorting domain-containing protein [Parasphingorhabdus cellanae]QTD57569.1 PEP-CTERM sorting domain-containing protein [Parasphingorhabdus cellanae]
MKIKSVVQLAATTALALAVAAPASAAVFVGSRDVGAATATFTITTDDTIGVLGRDNILDYRVVLDNGINTERLFSGDAFGTDLDVEGTSLSATATQLLFDFDVEGFFQFDPRPTGNDGYCAAGSVGAFANFCNAGAGSNELLIVDFDFSNNAISSGTQVLAAAVPEPGTWMMMILGFGAIGGAMRSRRRANVQLNYS